MMKIFVFVFYVRSLIKEIICTYFLFLLHFEFVVDILYQYHSATTNAHHLNWYFANIE